MFLDGEEVGEDVVRERLEVTVDWVESVCGEGGGNDPLVVWLVDVLVDERVVFQSVNPVNAVIGEEEEPKSQIMIQERSEETRRSPRNLRTLESRGRTKPNRVHRYCYTAWNTQGPLPRTKEVSRASSPGNSAGSF